MMKRFVNKGISSVILLFIIIINILPFVYMIFMSFKSTINAYDFRLDGFTLEQYYKIFNLDNFGLYTFNSVFVAVMGVILTVAVCSFAGYAFAKYDFKGNNQWFLFLVLTLIVPSELIIVPLFLIVRSFGWLNTFKALILPLPTAFGVFIMRQAILDVPQDLIDAAKIDGAGDVKLFLNVILPNITSSILAVSIFTFVGAWNNFIWPLVACIKPEMKTLPVALSTMKTQYTTDVGLTMACAVITFLPPFIFYMVMQSKFKQGMTLSGMKG